MNFSYDTLADAEKIKKEADMMLIKCEAKLTNNSSLYLKEER
jgi:hypothetical protein